MEEYEPEIKHIQSALLSSPVEHLQVFNPLFRSFILSETMQNPRVTLKPKYEFVNLDLIKETCFSPAYHKRPVHIKYSPLLDPLRFMIGKYDGQSEMDKHLCFADDYPIHPTKYKDVNNASYVDSFFCFLSSRLLHKYDLQNAIDFYGSFSGVQQEFSIDIFDDYEYLNDYSGFLRKINSGEVVSPDFTLLKQLHSIGGNSHNNSRGVKQRICLEETLLNEDVLSELVLFDNADIVKKEEKEEKEETINQGVMVLEYEKSPVDYENEDDDYTEWDDDELDMELSNHTDNDTKQGDLLSLEKCNRVFEPKDPKDKEENSNDEESEEENSNDEESEEENSNDEESKEENSNDEESKEENSNDEKSEEENSNDEDEEEEEEEEKMMAIIKNFPVQLICLEKCEGTIDSVFCNEEINSNVCIAYAFQIVATLAAYQKAYSFTHNDLHTNNIVYCSTTQQYLYYRLFEKTYRVPTYGKILKIIDFGRSVYRFQDRKMMSDGFSPTGDAHTQYNTEPYYNPLKPRIEENPSFDLCRLGCSIFDFVFDDRTNIPPVEEMDAFQRMIHRWCLDDQGKSVLYKKNGQERFPNFKLYKMIAQTVHQHTPENQMADFSEFLFEEPPIVGDGETGCLSWINIDKIPAMYINKEM